MFTTKINITEYNPKISHEDKILTLGSCFSENIGRKLKESYFDVNINPFGILYNPASIKNSLDILLENKKMENRDLFFDGSLWHSFSHSSLFSDVTSEKCLEKINLSLNSSYLSFNKIKFLLITFGTAWVYKNKKNGEVVSNCHKLPSKDFIRFRLDIDSIVEDYIKLFEKLMNQIPDLHIIFTVSPIRHWKDGAHENNISKSILLLAIDKIIKQFENAAYFPAYEILLDELRDYRYYSKDMLHPSETALDYIWEIFSNTYFSRKTQQINNELKEFNSALAHKPLHPGSQSFIKFTQYLELKKESLTHKYPFLKEKIEAAYRYNKNN